MTIQVGSKSVGMTNNVARDASLPPIPNDNRTHIQELLKKVDDLFLAVEGKADVNKLRTLIGFSDEAILLQAEDIGFVGEITIANIINEQNGSTVGLLPNEITRIVGPMIKTGSITSTNWGAEQGTSIDLDNARMTLGGSDDPDFHYDGAGNLTIKGTLQAGSVIADTVTVGGVTVGTIKDHTVATGNPHSTSFTQMIGDLDDIADGSSFFKSTAEQNVGGDRAYAALNSSFEYIRALSTQQIVVSGSNPTNGIVIDSSGMRGYSAGSLTVNIPVSGASTWSGSLISSGEIYATGSHDSSGQGSAALTGHNIDGYGVLGAGLTGVIGSGTSVGVVAIASSGGIGLNAITSGAGKAVQGAAAGTEGYGGHFSNSAPSGVGLKCSSGKTELDGDLTALGDAILGSITTNGTSQLNGVTNLATTNVGSTLTINSGLIKANNAGSRINIYDESDNSLIGTYRYSFT